VVLAFLVLVCAVWLASASWPVSLADRWQAVAALATVVAAASAVAGLVAVVWVYRQTLESQRRFRVELGPYLRVDFGPEVTSGTWQPPPLDQVRNRLTYEDVNPGATPEPTPLDAWPGDMSVCVWLYNTQTHAAGVAHDVEVDVELRFPDRTEHDVVHELTVQLRVTYLEPEQRIQYLVASVDGGIPSLVGRVSRLKYLDLYEHPLSFGHGSAAFTLDTGALTNERVFFRSE
jgi:hypothetical protein